MENPVVPPFLRNIPTPPPPLDWMIQVIQSYPAPFQNFMADENNYFGIEIPENNFFCPSSFLLETICPDKISQPPPPSEPNGRPLVYTGNQTKRK